LLGQPIERFAGLSIMTPTTITSAYDGRRSICRRPIFFI
jgi:hypothetical protein